MATALDEEAIFQAARRLAGDARLQYLDLACPADGPLRKRIEQLLAVHDAGGSFLEASPAAVATIERPPAERPGTRVGRYRLLENIGEGGMGTVWVAEQTEPVKRRVALKLIKPGMDSRQVLSRFEAERQALALMDHPNIAKFIDAGMVGERRASVPACSDTSEDACATGHPYFVMEYVKGMPITEYCDSARLSIHDRLKLFIPVCQAVQHAHQKGIIHRDLKPSNILVCLYDGQPIPKVIDFGLAKAMHQPLTEHTLYTAHGLMVGTPIYMSPEQAEFNNLDVDTRTDIYSLGVILYELLTGTTPLEKKQFKDAAFQEILRLIKDVEPQRPSLKISSLSRVGLAHRASGAASPNAESGGHSPPYTRSSLEVIAAQRSLDPTQLSRTVRGDLDWIVMKSLEKERSRRYESASGLARDVERFLSNEPIHARPPSSAYRLRKFAMRNKAAVAAGLLVAASLLIGIAISTWQAIRATAAEQASQENMQKLQRVAHEWATGETLTGDPQRAEAAIRLAEAASVSKAWTEILRAMAEIGQGLYATAVDRLGRLSAANNAAIDNDSRLAALWAMAYSHVMKGDLERGYIDCTQRANALQVDPGPEAGMFMAMAQSFAEPEDALVTLDAAAKKRAYPATLLIRANILSYRGGSEAAIADALKNLDSFELFAGKTPLSFAARINAHVSGHDIAQLAGDRSAAEKHLQELGLCTGPLEQQTRSRLTAVYLNAIYYRLKRYDKVIETAMSVDWGDSPLIEFTLANIVEMSDNPATALDTLERLHVGDDNLYLLHAKGTLLAELGDSRGEALRIVRRMIAEHKDSPNARFKALAILALLGRSQEMENEAKQVIEQLGSSAIFYLSVDHSLRYLGGEWDEARLLRESSHSVIRNSYAHYSIGIKCLALGDRNAARLAFEKSVRTTALLSYVCWWSRAYLARMNRDSNWPSWIEKKAAAE